MQYSVVFLAEALRIIGEHGRWFFASTDFVAMESTHCAGAVSISGAIKCLFKSATPICSPDLPNDS
jgi:hypothetical protein